MHNTVAMFFTQRNLTAFHLLLRQRVAVSQYGYGFTLQPRQARYLFYIAATYGYAVVNINLFFRHIVIVPLFQHNVLVLAVTFYDSIKLVTFSARDAADIDKARILNAMLMPCVDILLLDIGQSQEQAIITDKPYDAVRSLLVGHSYYFVAIEEMRA